MSYDASTQWYQSKGGGAPFAVTGSAQKSMDIGPASQYIFLGTGPTPPVVAAYTEGGEKPLTVQNIHTGEVKNVYGQNAQRNLDTAVWKPYTGQILYETTTPEQRRQAMSNIPNQEIAKMQFLKSPTAVWAPGESFYNAFVTNYGRAPTAEEQFGVITPETAQQTATKAAMLKSPTAEYVTKKGQVFSPSETTPTEKEGQGVASDLGFYTAQTRKMVVVNPDFKPATGTTVYVSTPEQKTLDKQMMTKYGSDYLNNISNLSKSDTQKLVDVGILKYETKKPAPSSLWIMPTDINPATGRGYAAPEPQTPSGMYVEKSVYSEIFHAGAERVVNVISQWENIADIGATRIEAKLPPIASVAYPILYSFGRGAFFEAPKMTVSAVGMIPGGTEAIIKTQGKVLVPAATVSVVGLYESSKEGITTKPFEFAGTLTGQAALFEGARGAATEIPSLKIPSGLKEFAISEEASLGSSKGYRPTGQPKPPSEFSIATEGQAAAIKAAEGFRTEIGSSIAKFGSKGYAPTSAPKEVSGLIADYGKKLRALPEGTILEATVRTEPKPIEKPSGTDWVAEANKAFAKDFRTVEPVSKTRETIEPFGYEFAQLYEKQLLTSSGIKGYEPTTPSESALTIEERITRDLGAPPKLELTPIEKPTPKVQVMERETTVLPSLRNLMTKEEFESGKAKPQKVSLVELKSKTIEEPIGYQKPPSGMLQEYRKSLTIPKVAETSRPATIITESKTSTSKDWVSKLNKEYGESLKSLPEEIVRPKEEPLAMERLKIEKEPTTRRLLMVQESPAVLESLRNLKTIDEIRVQSSRVFPSSSVEIRSKSNIDRVQKVSFDKLMPPTTSESTKITPTTVTISKTMSNPFQATAITPDSITKQISKTIQAGIQKETFAQEEIKVPVEFGSGGGEVERVPKPLGAYIPDQFPEKRKKVTRRKVSSYTIKNPLPGLEELIGTSSGTPKNNRPSFKVPKFKVPEIDLGFSKPKKSKKRRKSS